MKSIVFTCEKIIPYTSIEICAAITELEHWNEFKGYAFLPGIQKAEYAHKTENMIGTCIKVLNRDGSSHTETIYKWNPDKEVAMKFGDFTPPLSKIATHFTEEWLFETIKGGTNVKRTFALFPRTIFSKPLLWFISLFFRKAVDEHLMLMSQSNTKAF